MGYCEAERTRRVILSSRQVFAATPLSRAYFAVPLVAFCIVAPRSARASFFSQLQSLNPGDNSLNFGVLYTGGGNGNQLSLTNVTINGNIGVGGTGKVALSGPGTVNGFLDFSASNTGQYSSTNSGNVQPSPITYGVSAVTVDLNDLASLSTTLGNDSGTAVTISGTQTVTATNGVLTNGNYVFTASVNDTNGQVLTINGAGLSSNQDVVFNLNAGTNLNGLVTLVGLNPDQVIFNVIGGNSVSLVTNASSYSTQAWQGIILDPTGTVSMDNSNLDGRIYGGDSSNMQIVSGDTLNQPLVSSTPEPSSLSFALIGFLLGGFGIARNLRARKIQ